MTDPPLDSVSVTQTFLSINTIQLICCVIITIRLIQCFRHHLFVLLIDGLSPPLRRPPLDGTWDARLLPRSQWMSPMVLSALPVRTFVDLHGVSPP